MKKLLAATMFIWLGLALWSGVGLGEWNFSEQSQIIIQNEPGWP